MGRLLWVTVTLLGLVLVGCGGAGTSAPVVASGSGDARPAALRRYNEALIYRLELQAIGLAVGTDSPCESRPAKPVRCRVIEDEYGEAEEMVCD